MKGFVWCPHCGSPHGLSETVCPDTGLSLHVGKVAPKAVPRARASSPTPDAQPINVGDVIDDRYLVGTLLGKGGFGTVHEAENRRFGGRVALKILDRCDEGTVRRFNQEARIAGTILHPNVCRVFDAGWVKDRPFIVMELLSGETLADRIAKKGPLKVASAVDVVIQVLAGLGAAHDLGIVHRDVKPHNVFLTYREGCSPMVKLLDFGLAKALSAAPLRNNTMTMPGRLVGTIAYMSPEQLMGERLDGRSDLFSCAVLLFEALTGVLPWHGRAATDISAAILRDAPRPLSKFLPKYPPELEAVLLRALEKDRNKRFQRSIDFMRALGNVHRKRTASPVALSPDHGEEEATTRVGWAQAYEATVIDSRLPELEDDATTNVVAHPPVVAVRRDAAAKLASQLPRLYTSPPSSSRNVARRRGGSSS